MDTQDQLDEEYELIPEQIRVDNEIILKSLGEIKRKLEDIDARLTSLEKDITFISSPKDLPDYYLEEKQHSTCFSCRWENKHCTLYFEDLYDFDKREINTNIGTDSNCLKCRCGHLIRFHERHPSNSSQIKISIFSLYF
jgi:hypothetical protein